jgi:hypothetical protein
MDSIRDLRLTTLKLSCHSEPRRKRGEEPAFRWGCVGRKYLFLVFLGLPQRRHIVHSFCTRGEVFSVAGRNEVDESGCSET